MGKLCSKEPQIVQSSNIDTEPEVSVKKYTSDGDSFLSLQENKFNYFRKLSFVDYLYSLVNFSSENATLEDDYTQAKIEYSMNDPFFCEMFSNDVFQSFLENKILKHKSIYVDAGNNEKVTDIFKRTCLAQHDALGMKLAQNAKSKGDESADKNSIVKKGDALVYGILYCAGANFLKIKALFNIFQQGGQFKSSERFSEFLLSLALISSYCIISARNKLKTVEEIGAIDQEKLKELLGSAELKDCQYFVEVVNKMLFGEDLSGALTYDQFKAQFSSGDESKCIGFLLSPSGVRAMLKKYNQ